MNKYNIKRLNGTTLKYIAMVSMLIDHFFGSVWKYYVANVSMTDEAFAQANKIYKIGRAIGRPAFPIYVFLLIEGVNYTRSRWKYLRNTLIFAIISEIPFDLALRRAWFDWSHQNVFFTLSLIILSATLIQTLDISLLKRFTIGRLLLNMLVWTFAGCLAYTMKTDYSYKGIVLGAIFYYLRNERVWASALGYSFFMYEPWCAPAFVLMQFYDGTRGKINKYMAYAFYPAHLMVWWIVTNVVLFMKQV